MDRHVANAMTVAAALKSNPAVAWISYPGLPEHPDYRLAQRLFPKGAGSMIAFGIKGGREAGRKFIEALNLASHLANVGDAKTLIIHPASTTHSQMDAASLKKSGVGEDLVRLSVGLEAASDIIDDLTQALRVSQKSA
jgi:O-acetylhomoserine (thiol)-lyase